MTETPSPDPADRPSPFPWPPVLLATAIGGALAMDWLFRLPIPFAETGVAHYVGMLLLMAGIGLVIWAALQFKAFDTSIRPDRGSAALLLAGPYAFSRNPIYLGEVVAQLGAALAFNSLWLLIGAIFFAVLVTRLAISPEEAYLARRFGRPYLDYSAHVRRWL
ncbi:MAG: isoprenylcysteine carboxylmethyltransferase family protein [Proteobacteria bacterium]|nr:isoprenylcysteine carboxylmethyltransferase family protein [Pseudomonadota bacterium]